MGTLVTAARSAYRECRRIRVPEGEFIFENDFVVRLYHALVEAGIPSESLVFEWKYPSISRAHIDMIYTDGKNEYAVEVEPIATFLRSPPYIRRAKMEIKSVGRKLRRIKESEVRQRIMLVPYIGNQEDLPFDQIESELKLLAGKGIELRLVHD